MAEDSECAVSTFLFALTMLPKLRGSGPKFAIIPKVAMVSSLVHHYTNSSAVVYSRILESIDHASLDFMQNPTLVSRTRCLR